MSLIDWKAMAHHQRYLRRLAERHEVDLKRRLGAEHDKRVTLVNAMSDLLPRIVDYGWCCEGIGAHAEDCPYIAALAAVAEAGRSEGAAT